MYRYSRKVFFCVLLELCVLYTTEFVTLKIISNWINTNYNGSDCRWSLTSKLWLASDLTPVVSYWCFYCLIREEGTGMSEETTGIESGLTANMCLSCLKGYSALNESLKPSHYLQTHVGVLGWVATKSSGAFNYCYFAFLVAVSDFFLY